MEQKLILSFTGKTPVTHLKFRDFLEKGLITFAEIRIPRIADLDNVSILENKFDCKIVEAHSFYIIIPKLIDKYFEKEGFLYSQNSQLIKELAKWLKTNFRGLIEEILIKRKD